MSTEKKKRIQRLRKRRIWPSIVIFIALCMVLGIIMFVAVQMFFAFLVSNKAVDIHNEAGRAAEIAEEYRAQTGSLDGVVNYLADNNFPDTAMLLCDSDNNVIEAHAENIPDLNNCIKIVIFDSYVFYADTLENSLIDVSGGDFSVNSSGIVASALSGDIDGKIRASLWCRNEIGDTGMYLVSRSSFDIRNRDVAYLVMLIGMMCIFFSFPIIIAFINVIVSIVSQRKTTRLFYTDTVTGGRNWAYFEAHGDKILSKRAHKRNYALVDVKLLKYRSYVACHGINEGEELLERIDRILCGGIGRKELVAHNAHADFGMLIQCDTPDICKERLDRVVADLTAIGGTHRLTYHVGVYFINPEYRFGINNLYTNAAAAASSVSDNRNTQIVFFNDDIMYNQLWEHRVEDRMENALANEEFKVYLQPKYSPADEKLVGAEALVRWISPTDGFIAPNRFIPIFEENGFITKLDDYMIAHVAALQSQWISQGKNVVPVSVNVSRIHFLHEDLAEHICSIVDSYGTPHECIELELTESAFFDDKEQLLATVSRLKDYGFIISMDDFGAGYSSLNSLKELPLDILKLDGEFFRGDNTKERGDIVVSEAIRLAKQLDMKIVAEGIEKKEQVDFLASQGCDMIQGFYFAKPMPVADFERRM